MTSKDVLRLFAKPSTFNVEWEFSAYSVQQFFAKSDEQKANDSSCDVGRWMFDVPF